MRERMSGIGSTSMDLGAGKSLPIAMVALGLILVAGLWILQVSREVAAVPESTVGTHWDDPSMDQANRGASSGMEPDGGSLHVRARALMYGMATVAAMLVGWLLIAVRADHARWTSRRNAGSPGEHSRTKERQAFAERPNPQEPQASAAARLPETDLPLSAKHTEDAQACSVWKTDGDRSSPGFTRICDTDARQLAATIIRERSQTMALILTQIEPEHAALVLAQLSPERQLDVTRRVLAMDTVSPDLLAVVEEELAGRMLERRPRRLAEHDGMTRMAAIIRSLDRASERSILERLEASDGQTATRLKQCLFAFSDIAQLNDASLRRLLMEVSTQEMATALAEASSEVKQRILSQVSPRVADIMREEMSYVGPMQAVEARAAQRRVVEAVLRLESEDQIERPGRKRTAGFGDEAPVSTSVESEAGAQPTVHPTQEGAEQA